MSSARILHCENFGPRCKNRGRRTPYISEGATPAAPAIDRMATVGKVKGRSLDQSVPAGLTLSIPVSTNGSDAAEQPADEYFSRRVTTRRYALRPAMVRTLVPPNLPGHYVLFGADGVWYVGRSDTCLRRRLLRHAYRRRALYFQFDVHTCVVNAWIAECSYFHAFRDRLDNVIHPGPPVLSDLRCPFCRSNWAPRLFSVSIASRQHAMCHAQH